MESHEDFVYDEQNEITLSVLSLITADGYTLRQLQNIQANAVSIKQAVDEKISEYHAQVREALDELDGTRAAAVSLLTGIPIADFEKYGGFEEDKKDEDI